MAFFLPQTYALQTSKGFPENLDVFYCIDLSVASNQPLGPMHPQNIAETEYLHGL